ncbi:MAG: hypothetical protein KDB03_00175 [Planctomycetales bacterium]|nr:hypothetical protein [Planctomycetales bacterium]
MKMRIYLSVALLVLAVAGCGGDNRPATYPVSGVVTLDGKPVQGASISFTSIGEGVQPAVAQTDADGKYSLTTFESGDGAMEGVFQVTATKYHTEAGENPYGAPTQSTGEQKEMSLDDQYANFDANYGAKDAGPARSRKPGTTTNELPKRYANGSTSGLEYTVTPEGKHTFDIPLTSK